MTGRAQFAWLVLGASLLAACLGPAPANRIDVKLARPVVQVPMHLDNGVPMIEVRVAGQGPFWFKIDTGSGPCMLSERLVARTKTPVWQAAGKLLGADGGTRAVSRLAETTTLTIGESVRFGKVKAWVLPEADLDARGTVNAVDGILGFSAFADLVVTLDYPRRRLVLSNESLPEPDGVDVLPMALERGTPVVVANLGDASFAWLIDSGNDQGPALPAAAAKKLQFAAAPVSGPLLATVAGTTRAQLARCTGALALGRHAVPQPIVTLLDGARPMLGAEALHHFAVTLDARGKRARFVRTAKEPIEIKPRLTDGLGLRRARTGWVVVDVVPDSSAAQAGIVVGEEVTAIETTAEGAYRIEVGTYGVTRTRVLETRVLVQ